jgi:hypothetical protein
MKKTARDLDQESRRSLDALANLVKTLTPWLLDIGSWVFGGMIAFDLVIISALITVGPADGAILISLTALVCALPLNVTGVFLLRLIQDMKDIRIDDLALRAFQDSGFPDIEAHFPPSRVRKSLHKRRSDIALRYSLAIATLSFTLTLIGLVAALWHMAWWMGIVLLGMVMLSTVLVIVAMAHSLPPDPKQREH